MTAPSARPTPVARSGADRRPDMWPGRPYPLGATYDGIGTNFSIFSEVADRVELCLFDRHRETRLDMEEVDGNVWHAYLPSVRSGQRYGYRIHGPWRPEDGLLCNPNKLLLDPYAKAIDGNVKWDEAVFPYRFGDAFGTANRRNSARFVPKAVVVNPFFDWENDRRPNIPLHDTVIYEAHVKGLTMRHPEIPPELRGTYAGLAHPAIVDYLVDLGITSLELLPVHKFIHHQHLVEKGLRSYWGYDSIAYFAPHDEYAHDRDPEGIAAEFKAMVKTLHRAGIEVIMDVVYNHTAEGNHLGPMLSLRGIDNRAYYRTVADDPRYYMDTTGTGNSLNMKHPHVLQMIMDSLRYWVTEMHVDGFRFDLASTLARELHDVDKLSTFFDLIQQDPVVNQVKLIAEPWDIGEGGYQVGNFPPLWSEWNGIYRDEVRDYWRGDDQTLAELAARFTGSSDLYEATGRRPFASVNFITAHDGYTLRDLVSYEQKHNEANGEDSQDGTNDNRSWNSGAEGPTDDPAINEVRGRRARSIMATLLLSQGIPMILGGDEIGRTQGGNNNAYCQDNEISWFDWDHVDEPMLEFTRRLVAFRNSHPVFRRRRWFQGRSIHGIGVEDVGWFTSDGSEMKPEQWDSGYVKTLGIYLNGDAIENPDERGRRIVDDTFYLLFNSHFDAVDFRLPPPAWSPSWTRVLDTSDPQVAADSGTHHPAESIVTAPAWSLVVLQGGA